MIIRWGDSVNNEIREVHEDKIAAVNSTLPSSEIMERASDILKALGDRTRFNIVSALIIDDLCVADICEILRMNQSAVSHQLKVLKDLRIVSYKKVGKQTVYSVFDAHVKEIISIATEHILHS